eukprot:TRINITY_DN2263_c0_g3_i13.p1 TRINITY_DN2263_c0_g3~~TRINITY_DN2263_c0_g3_i13.p1  ORF type:complete len:310 (+),score=134.02 TRINITY_DN2263_c0_g3_i13:1141-2070(+)
MESGMSSSKRVDGGVRMALFHMEEYESAQSALNQGQAIQDDKKFKTWLRKCAAELGDEEGEEGVTGVNGGTSTTSDNVKEDKKVEEKVEEKVETVIPPLPQYRQDWYQETDCVFLTVFVRGVDHDSVTVKVESTQVLIDGKMEDGEPLHVVFGPLFEEIETTGWTVTKRARKIEVMVMKKEKLTWADLTAQTGKEGVVRGGTVNDASSGNMQMRKDLYPSSKGDKKWEDIEKEVIGEEDLEEDKDGLSKLLQSIYANASEETKRAMNKSFQESNGTVLSTNWQDVGSRYVEGSPPEGMEMHNWNENEKK